MGGLEGGIDLFGGGGLFQLAGQVHQGDVGGGHAHGHAVQLALEGGHHQGQGLGRAGGGGDHGHAGGAGTAQVLVGTVQDALAHGVGVDGGHQAVADAEGIVEDLGHGSQTVGGTGGSGKHGMGGGIVDVVIDAHDDGGVGFLAGGRDHDLLGAALQVLGGVLAFFQGAGGFHGDVDAEAGPFPLTGLAAGDFDMTTVDDDAVVVMIDGAGENAVHRVVFEKVGQRSIVGAGVDGGDADVFRISQQTQQIATDAAKAVHPQRYGHVALLHAREMKTPPPRWRRRERLV